MGYVNFLILSRRVHTQAADFLSAYSSVGSLISMKIGRYPMVIMCALGYTFTLIKNPTELSADKKFAVYGIVIQMYFS